VLQQQGWKGLPETNALAYLTGAKKIFNICAKFKIFENNKKVYLSWGEW